MDPDDDDIVWEDVDIPGESNDDIVWEDDDSESNDDIVWEDDDGDSDDIVGDSEDDIVGDFDDEKARWTLENVITDNIHMYQDIYDPDTRRHLHRRWNEYHSQVRVPLDGLIHLGPYVKDGFDVLVVDIHDAVPLASGSFGNIYTFNGHPELVLKHTNSEDQAVSELFGLQENRGIAPTLYYAWMNDTGYYFVMERVAIMMTDIIHQVIGCYDLYDIQQCNIKRDYLCSILKNIRVAVRDLKDVHGDLAMDNIGIDQNGVVKIFDYGYYGDFEYEDSDGLFVDTLTRTFKTVCEEYRDPRQSLTELLHFKIQRDY